MVYPNSVYPDLYDNNKNTTDIQVGTVSGVTATQFMMGDFTVPEKPIYGAGEMVGAKLGVYINTITAGNTSPGIPGLKAYKVPVNIGNREGGKTSAGSLISVQNFAQICAYHSHDGTETETFDGYTDVVDEESEVVQDVVIKKTDPYLTRTDGYRLGRRFGESRTLFGGIGSSKHHRRYGQTVDGEDIYKIKHDERNKSHWFSVKENKHWRRFNREKWADNAIGGGAHSLPTYAAKKKDIIKWGKRETIARTNTNDDVQRANTSNTFFDGIKESTTFLAQDKNGNTTKAAFGNVAFSSSKVKSGGQSLHLHTVYPHRDLVDVSTFYPLARNEFESYTSGQISTENQQTVFVTKELPLPVHLYSARSKGSGSGDQDKSIKPVMPTVEICLNIDSLAPMIESDITLHGGSSSEPLTGNSPDQFRLNRSIVVTFGEEKPGSKDTLYTYVLRHAPNSGGAGTGPVGAGNPTGNGTGARSFMGLAIVNNDGVLTTTRLNRYFHSDPANQGGYTDVSFRLDQKRGEIALAETPSTANKKTFDGVWANLEFQLHPDFSGAYFSISDPETGDILTTDNPYSSGVLRNIKNVVASSSGQWAMNDTANFPRYMTIWVNNYQAIKGGWDKDMELYRTGLKSAELNADNVLRVYTAREHDTGNLLQGAASTKSASFTNIRSGDSLVGATDSQNDTLVQDDDGNTVAATVVESRNTTLTSGFPSFDISSTYPFAKGQHIYFAAGKDPDKQVPEPSTMETSVFVDKISLRNFGMKHGNATPNASNSVPSRIKIPKTYQSSPPAYTIAQASTVDNITTHTADHPSYICLGFDEISDFEGSEKLLLMNGFTVGAANTEIFLGDDANVNSDFNCLRVGYTSAEDYGRQGAVDSYSRTQDTTSGNSTSPSWIPTESPTFSNGDGTPNSLNAKGLLVGDQGQDSAEFSVDSEDDATVHGFTQKGLIRWNFNRRVTEMAAVDLTTNCAAGGATVKVDTLTSGSATLKVNDYIQLSEDGKESEQMQILSMENTGTNNITLNVEKSLNGVSESYTAAGATLSLLAMPEKRECIFTSARVLEILDDTRIRVDSPSLFNFPDNQEYLIYIYNDSHAAPTSGYPKTIRVIGRNNSEIEFDTKHGIPKESKFKYLVSPKKYWLMMEIHNFADSGLVDEPVFTKTSSGKKLAHSTVNASTTTINLANGDGATFEVNDVIIIDDEHIQITGVDVSGNPDVLTVLRGVFGTTAATHRKNTPIFFAGRRYLPEKNYESAVIISEKGTFGATFNETLYNDGDNINHWDLDPFIKADDTAIDLKDYGYGDFDEEKQSGGHLANINLNLINDVSKYKELDISGVVTVDNVKENETFTVLISPDEPTDSFKINVDTETGTNKPFVTMIYEDELPTITDFKLAPNPDDPFNIDYTWTCADVDSWYGFLHVSPEGIKDQYHGAILHMPLNDAGNHGDSVSETTNTISTLDKNGDSLIGTEFNSSVGTSVLISDKVAIPKHDVEGLAGNCLKFDLNDIVIVGNDGTNCLAGIEKEMSVNVHVTHATGIFTADKQYILYKGLLLENQTFSIHAERIGTSNTGRVVARVYSDGGSPGKYVQLLSSTVFEKDIPMNIILTFDANLVTGNVKLFINGKLEDQSGPVVTSHSNTATGNSGWIHKTNANVQVSPLHIGSKSDANTSTSAEGWNGKIEELVIYEKVLYPVDVKSGKFTFTKPLKDLLDDISGTSQSYSSRLFVKDYHNIRGRRISEVATTPNLSHRKAAFKISGVVD